MVTPIKSKPQKSNTKEVDDFMHESKHPLKAQMQAIRSIILGVDPNIIEQIKWKAPSFAYQEHFATFNPRDTNSVQVILHLGAKVKATKLEISDPSELLQWLSKDRACVKFQDLDAVTSNRAALEDIVRQWIAYLQ